MSEGERRTRSTYGPDEFALPAVVLESLSDMVKAVSTHARITMLTMRDDEVEVSASMGAGPAPVGTLVRLPEIREFASIIQEKGMAVIDRTDVPESLSEVIRAFEFERGLFALISSHNGVIECALVDEPGRAMEFGERERRLFDAMVLQARAALENERLRLRAVKQQRSLSAVARLGVILASELDLGQTAEQIVEYAALLLDLPAFVLLYRPEGAPDFFVLASAGVSPGLTRCRVRPIEVAAVDARRPGELTSGRLPEGESGSLFALLGEAGLRNTVFAPLVIGNKLRGALLGLDGRVLDLENEDHEALQLLAMQATSAIWNAERHESEVSAQRQATRELETTGLLLDAAALFASSLDVHSVLRGLIDVVTQATGRDRIVVSLFGDEDDALVVRAVRGEGAPRPDTQLEMGSLPFAVRRSINEKRTMVVDFESSDTPEEDLRRAGMPGMKLALSVPLVTKDRVIGHLGIDDKDSRCDFTRREIGIVEGIASQASVALENARLFEQTRTVAEMLQQALLTLPDHIHGIDFAHAYRAASAKAHVGGDFYDIFEVGNDRVGVLIGDISGKGLRAAVLTSLLKDTIRAHTIEADKTPARILYLTNEIFYKTTAVEQFATVFFGILDRRDGHFIYANAGHTTGAVIRSDHQVNELLPSGPIVGAFPGVTYHDRELRLALGETLLLYTDGLTEARRGDEQLGEDRVLQLLTTLGDVTPEYVVGRLIDQLKTFTRGVLRDDLALFALRRLESGAQESPCHKLPT